MVICVVGAWAGCLFPFFGVEVVPDHGDAAAELGVPTFIHWMGHLPDLHPLDGSSPRLSSIGWVAR